MRSIYIHLIGFFFFSAHAWSAGLSDMLECSDIEIEAEINSELSRQENLERLYQQFDEAVNAVSHCDPTANGGGGGGGGSAGGGSAGGGSLSRAAEGISGTEVKSSPLKEEAKEAQADSASNNGNSGASETKKNQQGSNGKKPDKLNANDNDSIYAQQLKAAAEIEQDPVVKEQLLKEYRKFKSIIGK